MKESTKANIEFKLLKWFRKIFKYNPRIQPYIIEERKMQRLRSEHVLTESEKEFLDKEEHKIKTYIEDNLATNMVKTMLHIGAIKFEWSVNEDGSIRVTGTTFIPEKL